MVRDELAKAGAGEPRDYAEAKAAVARCHLREYERYPEVLAGICASATTDPDAAYRIRRGDTSAEWEFGHLLACAALEHADADLEKVYDRGDFAERATVDIGDVTRRSQAHALSQVASGLDRCRLEAVDLDHPFRSRQAVTAREVLKVAEDLELADDDGSPTACPITANQASEIAAEFASSLGGLELGSDEVQDFRSRIEERAREGASRAHGTVAHTTRDAGLSTDLRPDER